MHVHIPQSGDEELTGPVDQLCTLRDMSALRWNNRNNAIAIDDDSPVRFSSVSSGVNYSNVFNRESLGPCATAKKSEEEAQAWAEAKWAFTLTAQ
ncbi:MAG: hypothetical protein WBV28_00230 [Terracidiphilus sp.]|jgi:hypothetical protein